MTICENSFDVCIIGGGLSGLTVALDLAKFGFSVALIEKKDYPQHKVCGEYVSKEVLPYLDSLGFDPFSYGATNIERFQLSSVSGKLTEAQLPLGGFGLSRYSFDNALYNLALDENVKFFLNETVNSVESIGNQFSVKTIKGTQISSRLVIGAFGKRSVMDKSLDRSFINRRNTFFAVKCHYRGEFPEDLVSLHNFKGGYCGVSKVENDAINVCYLAWDKQLKKYGDIQGLQKSVLSKNPFLKKVFLEWEPLFEKPLSISQIYFSKKSLIQNGIIMTGDAAGLIYPLSGNGMAMAIRSAKILSDLAKKYLDNSISLEEMQNQYVINWNRQFSRRLKSGNLLQNFFGNSIISGTAVNALRLFPFLKKPVIKMTHGKVF